MFIEFLLLTRDIPIAIDEEMNEIHCFQFVFVR